MPIGVAAAWTNTNAGSGTMMCTSYETRAAIAGRERNSRQPPIRNMAAIDRHRRRDAAMLRRVCVPLLILATLAAPATCASADSASLSPIRKSMRCRSTHTCGTIDTPSHRSRGGTKLSSPESDHGVATSQRARAAGGNGSRRIASSVTRPLRRADSHVASASCEGRQFATDHSTFSTGSTRASGCRGTGGRPQWTCAFARRTPPA